MAFDPIKIFDKEWRDSWKRLRSEIKGTRKFKPADRFVRLKRRRLEDPWKRKGTIDEDGRTIKWKPNTRSTVARRNRRAEKMFGMLPGLGPTQEKKVTMAQRVRGLMVESGDLKEGVVAAWKPKKNQFVLRVTGPANKYAWVHLHGNKVNMTPARPWGEWTKRDIDNLKKIILKYMAKVL